jgi:hypothetical protein
MQLDPERLSDEAHWRLEGILAFSLNLESGGDVIERNVLHLAARQMKRESNSRTRRGARSKRLSRPRKQPRATATIFITGSARSSGADRAKEGVSSPGGRRDPRPSRPVADEQWKAGAAALDPFGVAPLLARKLITDARSCRRRSPAQYPGNSWPRRRQGRDNQRPSLPECRGAS